MQQHGPSRISTKTLYPNLASTFYGRLLLTLLDWVMGLNKLQQFYDHSPMPKQPPKAFCESLVGLLGRQIAEPEQLLDKVPNSGATIVVANHPFGCIEGVALAGSLLQKRADVKVLTNKGLSMFEELKSIFLFINPLTANDPVTLSGLRQAKEHLRQGGLLLIFPAGKVSYFRSDKQRICDDVWQRLPGTLVKTIDANVIPVFIEGHNSRRFILLGRIYYRLKVLMLFKELLNCRNTPIKLHVGNLLDHKLLQKLGSAEAITRYLRVITYLQQPGSSNTWPPDKVTTQQPLHPPISTATLIKEVQALPTKQHLVRYKKFDVYYGYQQQMPSVVTEITRLRELVFRQYNEGSGQAVDGDEFDQTYLHLFIFDQAAGQIIGAYRMGQSDKLLSAAGVKGLYLSRMFNFAPDFINQQQPCLEMGRSFIVPEHQRSFYGLFLLWRGIGEFVVRHPQYRTLYGTVSLSKLYQPLSVECISKLALTPCSNVSPKVPFAPANNPELNEFIDDHKSHRNLLSILIQGIEPDSKDMPILMKQYEKLSARFYCVGIDQNFNDTPGLLLSVDLPNAPQKALKQYLADGLERYLDYNEG